LANSWRCSKTALASPEESLKSSPAKHPYMEGSYPQPLFFHLSPNIYVNFEGTKKCCHGALGFGRWTVLLLVGQSRVINPSRARIYIKSIAQIKPGSALQLLGASG
jgi:hypothetical protein